MRTQWQTEKTLQYVSVLCSGEGRMKSQKLGLNLNSALHMTNYYVVLQNF
jgi:hypothetical protein